MNYPMHWVISEIIQTREVWRHEISRGIEKSVYGNSDGQLKMKGDFQEFSRETHVVFP